jgi:hypothetical protein
MSPLIRALTISSKKIKTQWGILMSNDLRGKLLQLCGIVILAIAFFMDTTVNTGMGSVYNIGLLAKQNNNYLLGGIALIAGIILDLHSKNEFKKDSTEANLEANRKNNELENLKAADEALYIESEEKSDDRITGLDLTIFWGAIILGVLFCDGFTLLIGGSLILLAFVFLGYRHYVYRNQIIEEMKAAKNISTFASNLNPKK